jgi:hypothetical protein
MVRHKKWSICIAVGALSAVILIAPGIISGLVLKDVGSTAQMVVKGKLHGPGRDQQVANYNTRLMGYSCTERYRKRQGRGFVR